MTDGGGANGSGPNDAGTDGSGTDGGDDVPLDIAGHDARSPPDSDDGPDGRSTNGDSGGATGDAGNGHRESDGAATNGHRENGEGLISDLSVTDGRGAADEETVEPVELLVRMADDGEIDPWDIDIVAVTDKFLDHLDEADLRTGGRALFYASVLLRMKSDAMLTDDDPDDDWEAEPWDAPVDDPRGGPAVDPFDQLEAEMERRLDRKHARQKPRTLDELVRELRERERETYWKERREYDTSDSPRGYSRGTQTLDYRAADDLRMDDEPTEADVTGTAHDEHMEDLVSEVYMALHEQYDKGRDEVLYAEIDDAAGTRVQTFLALLFLANRGQVRLRQDDLFGDLWIQDPAAVSEAGEAIAD